MKSAQNIFLTDGRYIEDVNATLTIDDGITVYEFKDFSKDEFENGLRADLNLGHTFGQAIESAYGFDLSHGECVGVGMLCASYISYKRGILKKNEFDKIEEILSLYGLKTRISIESIDGIYKLMKIDKKKIADKIRFILPEKIGSVMQCTDVEKNEIFDALRYVSL